MTSNKWFKNNAWLVLLAVLLVTASAATISVAMRVNTASDLHARTEQLNERVNPSEAPEPATEEPATDNGENEPRRRPDRGGGNENEAAKILAQRIDARNLFTSPPSPQFRNVIGVLGNLALYPGGDTLAVGEQREGATLTEVGADYVEFEFDGEKVRVNVLEAGAGGGGGPQMSGPPGRNFRGGGGSFGRPPGGPGGPSMGGGPGGGDRESMRARFENMTPEEREAAIAQFRSQRGGDGGGRRGQDGGGDGGERRGGERGGDNRGNQ